MIAILNRKALTVAVAVCLSSPTLADTNYDLAEQLGAVIASQDVCNFQVNEEAIQNAIQKDVREDDLEFPKTLEVDISTTAEDLKDYDELRLKLHCQQITRAAKKRGLIKAN